MKIVSQLLLGILGGALIGFAVFVAAALYSIQGIPDNSLPGLGMAGVFSFGAMVGAFMGGSISLARILSPNRPRPKGDTL